MKGPNSPHLPPAGWVFSEHNKDLSLIPLQAQPPPGLPESFGDMFFGDSKHQGQMLRGIWDNCGERRCSATFQVCVSVCVCVHARMHARVRKSTLTLMPHLGMTDAFLFPSTKWGCYEAFQRWCIWHTVPDIQQALNKSYLTLICSLQARWQSPWSWGLWMSYCFTLVPNTNSSPRSYQLDTSLRILAFTSLEHQYSR